MIERIKISKHHLLGDYVLDDLGKINVICGQNNSGKTTLLTAINNLDQANLGLVFDESTGNQLYKYSTEAREWPSEAQYHDKFKELLISKTSRSHTPVIPRLASVVQVTSTLVISLPETEPLPFATVHVWPSGSVKTVTL